MTGAIRRAAAWKMALLALAAALVPAPALAQEGTDARLRKLEAEIRALQRRVFPDGAARYFEPEIRPTTTPAQPAATASAVTDLLARVDTIEAQLARLTSQMEVNANQTGKLEARLAALENASAPAGAPGTFVAPSAGIPGAANGGPIAGNTTALAAVAPFAGGDRLAAVRAIVKPESGDAGEDDYLYGYRLWEARLFPEAAQQLKSTVEKYPRHKRVSYSRNLLGRAYLDDGKPGTAAQVFLQNYQADRNGARAPDSLLFLAVAMARLKETQRACVALQELSEAYPAEVAGRLAADYAAARGAVKCN